MMGASWEKPSLTEAARSTRTAPTTPRFVRCNSTLRFWTLHLVILWTSTLKAATLWCIKWSYFSVSGVKNSYNYWWTIWSQINQYGRDNNKTLDSKNYKTIGGQSDHKIINRDLMIKKNRYKGRQTFCLIQFFLKIIFLFWNQIMYIIGLGLDNDAM